MGNGTPIGKVRGLGSAHSGMHHWLLQRFTAIANLVLLIWLAVSFLRLGSFSYYTITSWLSEPMPATAMILLVVSLFWHARLGLQVVIEDYVTSPSSKFALFTVLNLVAFGGAAFGVFSVLKIAFANIALGGAA